MEYNFPSMKIFVLIIVFSMGKCTYLNESASLLNEQLRLLEQIIIISGPSNVNATRFMSMKIDGNFEEVKKRLLVGIKCSDVAKTRMTTFLRKYNDLLEKYFDTLYPANKTHFNEEKLVAVVREFTQNTVDLQQFCRHELPSLFFKIGQDVGLKFNQKELDSRNEILRASRQKSADTRTETFKNLNLNGDELKVTTDFARFLR